MIVRPRFLAVSVPVTALIVLATGFTHVVYAQEGTPTTAPPATATLPQTSASASPDPITTGLAAASLTDDQKTQIDTIAEKYRKEREALSPPTTTTTERPRLTPKQREQIAASEAREVTEIKAVLTPDQQTKFQTAYDTARVTQASAPTLAVLTEKLSLTEEEKAKVTPIVLEYTGEVLKLREDTTLDRSARQQKMTTLWDTTKAKIRPLLPSEKQTTLDGITSLRGGRPGGGTPPPSTPATPTTPPSN